MSDKLKPGDKLSLAPSFFKGGIVRIRTNLRVPPPRKRCRSIIRPELN